MTRISWTETEPLSEPPAGTSPRDEEILVSRFACRVISGPDAGLAREADGPELAIGTAAGNELELRDRTVSSHHCAVRAERRGFRLVDLGSTNGVWVGGVRVESAFLHTGAVLRLGVTRVRFEILEGHLREPLGAERRFRELVGVSAAMRHLFDRLRRLAPTASPVLVLGERDSGKTAVARALHQHSPRAGGPLVAVDCGGVSPERLDARRIAAAAAGSLLVEELGELEAGDQARLLALLQAPNGPRVIATTCRDPRADVNQGRLDVELYRRFHHARLRIPPLSERREDIRLLAGAFHRELCGREDSDPPPELLERLERPGYARTLRDVRAAVARALLLAS